MKLLMTTIACAITMAACNQDNRQSTVQFFQAHQKALLAQQQVHNFSLQLAYMPAAILPGREGTPPDTGYYHFRLQVKCPPGSGRMAGKTTALYYGLDSLFVSGGDNAGIYPISIQPVMTGSQTHFEYLLVFDKKDWKPGKSMEIIFNDRIFTNTRMSFLFDRTKINELERLHS